jgi:predicted component of type VI protein secretion system
MNTGKPHLVRLDTQEIVPVDRKLTVGRHPDCDYVVTVNDESAGISGRHASIEVDGEYARIEDLGSTNGTWVRGARIAQRTPLLPGERFLLDRLEFEFRAAEQPAAASSAPVSEKTVFAGRHAGHLPPVPVSMEAAAPQSPPPLAPQAVASRPAPLRAVPVESRSVPERKPAARAPESAPEQRRASRPVLTYIIVALGLVALAGAGIALLLR